MDGEGKQLSNEVYRDGRWILLECQNRKEKELTRLFWNKFNVFEFSPDTVFFPTCHGLKTWFEFSRIKLFRNDLKGIKNYFELAGGSI